MTQPTGSDATTTKSKPARFSVGTHGLKFPAPLATEEADKLQTTLDTFAWAAEMLEVHPVEFIHWHLTGAAADLRAFGASSFLTEWSHRGGIEYDDPEQGSRVRARVAAFLAETDPEFVAVNFSDNDDGSSNLEYGLGKNRQEALRRDHIAHSGDPDDDLGIMLVGIITREAEGTSKTGLKRKELAA